ncbi:MAG: MATE family efflux transporter [Clostridium sp.]|nr:MATE family efflux transporter [Clostridium sp.]
MMNVTSVQNDLTVGCPWKGILWFMFPLFLGNLFQQFYNMADAFIVSRGLGVEAFAAVSCTNQFSFLVIGFAGGLTSGLSIVLAQSFGAKDYQRLKTEYFHNILISIAAVLILTAIGLAAVEPVLRLLDTPMDIFPHSVGYLRVIFAGIVCPVFYNFYANTLRALGDSRSPFYYLLLASGLNILLDIAFVYFTAMGVQGAALATVLSQGVSVLLCMIRVVRRIPVLSTKGFKPVLDLKMMLRNLSLGIPMAFQNCLISLGTMAVQSSINGMGTNSIAAYAAACKLDGIAVEPLRSLGMALATFTGQNKGAGKHGRILDGVRQAAWISIGMAVLLGILMCSSGRYLAMIFVGGNEKEIIDLAQIFLTLHGIMYIILALLFVFRFALQGLGYTLIPTAAGFMELVMRVTAAFWIIPQFGFYGASLETQLSWLGALLPSLIAWMIVRSRLKSKGTFKEVVDE